VWGGIEPRLNECMSVALASKPWLILTENIKSFCKYKQLFSVKLGQSDRKLDSIIQGRDENLSSVKLVLSSTESRGRTG